MATTFFSPTNALPWLARLDPRVKLLYVFTVSVGAASARSSPESNTELWVLFAVTLLGVAGLRLAPRGWAGLIGVTGLLVWGTMYSQGFFYKGATQTVVWSIIRPSAESGGFSGLELTKEGILFGAEQSLRLVATLLAGLTVSLSTSPERMLAALSWFRLPATLSFMTTAALRFLPLFLEEFAEVRRARRLRGYRFRWCGLPGDRFGSYRAEIGNALPVIAAALRRGETLAESVTARGFDPYRPRTYYPPLEMRSWEQAAAVLLVVAAVVMIVARVFF
jgi:energy-coupling factor transport system permease protein